MKLSLRKSRNKNPSGLKVQSIGSKLRIKRFSNLHAILFIAIFAVAGVTLLQFIRAETVLDHVDWALFYPSEDAHVNYYKNGATWNSGKSPNLWVNKKDGSCATKFPDCFNYFSNQSYLKFNVDDKAGRTVKNVSVKLFVTEGSPDGGTLYEAANNNWNENTITWNNAPGHKLTALARAGLAKRGTWVTFTINLKNNPVKSDGTYSFVIASSNQDTVQYASRESRTPPQLVLVYDSPPIYNMPASIVGKSVCDTSMPDQSNEIYEWIETVPDGALARFRKDTCFRTESELPIQDKINFIVDGNGAKLQAFTTGCVSQDPNPKDDSDPNDYCKYQQTYPPCHPVGKTEPYKCTRPGWPQSRRRIDLARNYNLTIKNIKLDGGHPNPGATGTYDPKLAFQHGIQVSKDNNLINIDSVEIDRVYGDYIYIGGENINYVTIQNSKFGEMIGSSKHGTGRQGFGITTGQNITIKNNRIMQVRRTVVDIEPLSNNSVIRNFVFDNNVIGPHGLNFFSNHSYGTVNPVIENVYFRNNLHEANRFGVDSIVPNPAGINVNDPSTFRRRNYQFINNVSTGIDSTGSCEAGVANYGAYWRIWGIDGLVIKNTDAQTNPRRCMYLVRTEKVRKATITDNSLLNGKSTVLRDDTFSQICEKNNKVGNPLSLDIIQNESAVICK